MNGEPDLEAQVAAVFSLISAWQRVPSMWAYSQAIELLRVAATEHERAGARALAASFRARAAALEDAAAISGEAFW